MKLRELYDQLEALYGQELKAARDFVGEASEGLLLLLVKLIDSEGLDIYSSDVAKVLSLPLMKDNIALRYCGRFFNRIVIREKDDMNYYTAVERMRFKFVPFEDDIDGLYDLGHNFPCDGYTEDNPNVSKEYKINDSDAYEFMSLVRSLRIFFKGTAIEKEYSAYCSSLNAGYGVWERINDSIREDFDELLLSYFEGIFRTNSVPLDVRSFGRYFLRLPCNCSIRYRGCFHNCIGYDGYGVSLAYIKDHFGGAEDQYHQDKYTVGYDLFLSRNHNHTLVHEYYLDATWGGIHNVLHSLKALLNVCEEELEGGHLGLIRGKDVAGCAWDYR